jgi:hypothetical protein
MKNKSPASKRRGSAALSAKSEIVIIDGATSDPVEVKLPAGSIEKIEAEAKELGVSVDEWLNRLLKTHIDENTPRFLITAKELSRLCDDCAGIIEGELNATPGVKSSPAEILARWKKQRGGWVAKRMREGTTKKGAELDRRILDADAAMLERLLPMLAKADMEVAA